MNIIILVKNYSVYPVALPPGVMTVNTQGQGLALFTFGCDTNAFNKACQKSKSLYLKSRTNRTNSYLSLACNSAHAQRNKITKRLGKREKTEHFWITQRWPAAILKGQNGQGRFFSQGTAKANMGSSG